MRLRPSSSNGRFDGFQVFSPPQGSYPNQAISFRPSSQVQRTAAAIARLIQRQFQIS